MSNLFGTLHVAEVEKVVFRPDGEALASVSRDGTLKVWRVPKLDKRVSVCVADIMDRWRLKGEFEKTDEYEKRMKRTERETDQNTRDCRDRIINKFGNAVDWYAFMMGSYDADSETYQLKSRLFGDTYHLRVPPREAERVRANFSRTNFGVPSFDVELNTVVLKKVDITVPVEDYQKTCTIYR